MDFDFIVLKINNVVSFFKEKIFLVYIFIFSSIVFFSFLFIRKNLIQDSSTEYYNYIKKNKKDFKNNKQYGIYSDIQETLELKKNHRILDKQDKILYKRIFNIYDLLNNFDDNNYDSNLEGSIIWRQIFKTVRILNLKYKQEDLDEESNIPLFLRVYIGNEV